MAAACRVAPENRNGKKDQTDRDRCATARHLGAARGDRGGGADRADRRAFVLPMSVCRFADRQAVC
jgi:hypothetical protein